MWKWIKSKWQLSWLGQQVGIIRRRWKPYAIIIALLFLCYRMFISNYVIVQPIMKKDFYLAHAQDANELADCSARLDASRAAMVEANQDIMQ